MEYLKEIITNFNIVSVKLILGGFFNLIKHPLLQEPIFRFYLLRKNPEKLNGVF
jgi:hypothetical protein